jgi:ribosomal 50S subunit-recycling heat shock protein
LFDDLVDDLIEEGTVVARLVTVGGERLDKWLVGQLPEHSRAEIQRWIADDLVTAGNRPLKASYRVAAGDEVTVVIPPVEEYAVEAEAIPLEIVFEDADLLVINKPASMVVHPAAGNWHGTLVNASDYQKWSQNVGFNNGFGQGDPGTLLKGDVDQSGVIDLFDFRIITREALVPPVAPNGVSVPEPAAIALLLVGLAPIALRCSRRRSEGCRSARRRLRGRAGGDSARDRVRGR